MTDIKTALTDLLDRELGLDDALDRHFTPDYRQRTDGTWSDRAEFASHIAHLRSIVGSARTNVIDEHRDGTRYADRHTVDVAKLDGGCVVQEVYLFGEFAADGRFLRIEETTLMLAGEEADRDLGSAR
jgi:hypothetical protein